MRIDLRVNLQTYQETTIEPGVKTDHEKGDDAKIVRTSSRPLFLHPFYEHEIESKDGT